VATPVSKQRVPAVGLIRGLSRGHLLALHVNGIVGAGVLGLPSTAFAMSGAYSLVAWAVCAVIVAGIALCLAEVSSRYDQSGGPYLVALDAFGPSIGFIVGWLMWVSRVLAFATVGGLVVDYSGFFTTWTALGAGRVVLVCAVTGGITALLLRGIRQTAWVSTSLTLGKLALLVGFAIIGLLVTDAPALTAGPPPSFVSFAATVSVLLFAFFGFEAGSIATGETADPQRNVPFAICASIVTVTALYVLIQYACMVMLPDLGASRRPLADAAALIVGTSAGRIVAGGAVVVMLGTMLVLMIGNTRTLMAMSEQGQLPSFIANLHPGRRVPVTATLICSGAALAATLLSTFASAITIAVTTRVVTYAIVCLALPMLRRHRASKPAFQVTAGTVIALISAALSLSLVATAGMRDVVATVAVAASGWIVWRSTRQRWPIEIEHRRALYSSSSGERRSL